MLLSLPQDVENIVALPNEAAEAEEMLKDDSQLLQVLHRPPLIVFALPSSL